MQADAVSDAAAIDISIIEAADIAFD